MQSDLEDLLAGDRTGFARQRFFNNLSARLSAALGTSDTTILTTNRYGNWPSSLGANEYFALTLSNLSETLHEVVHVVALTSTQLTVVRAQEGTAAVNWATINCSISGRLTADMLSKGAREDEPNIFTEPNVFQEPVVIRGDGGDPSTLLGELLFEEEATPSVYTTRGSVKAASTGLEISAPVAIDISAPTVWINGLKQYTYNAADEGKILAISSGEVIASTPLSVTDAAVETAYNNQVPVVSQAVAEAGASTVVYRWTPERVADAIAALAPSGTVTSVNGFTGIVALDATDIPEAGGRYWAAEANATADQSDVEIETAYNNQVPVVSQVDAEAGTGTTVARWTPQRVAQAIASLAPGGGSSVSSVNGQTGVVTLDATDIGEAGGRFWASEAGATADQTNAEIAAAYNAEVGIVSQVDAEAGTSTTAARWTPQRVAQAIASLAPGGGSSVSSVNGQTGVVTLTTADISEAGGAYYAIEPNATADQSDSEIETAYNNRVAVVTQGAAETGTSTTVQRWTPQRVRQAIVATPLDSMADGTTYKKFLATERTKLTSIEPNAKDDQTDAEIETAYNNRVSIISQAEAEAGTATTVRRWTAQRVAQAINALTGGGSFNASTAYTLAGTVTGRNLLDRGKYEPINVLDFGADPTGSTSSTSAFNAAFAELRNYASGTGTAGGRLVIPHNRHASQNYVIDGNGVNATDLRGDGLCMVEAWGARIRGDMNAGLPMIDTSHSQGIVWMGGTLIGDSANPPRVGLQLTRKFTGTPGNNSNPSSQGHVLIGLATTGQFSVAPMLNYGSEELYAAFCRFENEYNSNTSFAIVQNGMHDSDYLPTSAYDTVGWGEFTGFANNVFHKCFFLHNNGSNGGPGVYLFRASGHHYDASLAQVRQDQPHFVIPHRAGVSTNASRDVTISGRYEDSAANSLLYFTGDAGAVHHGYRVKIDRMFAQSLAMADSSWSDGAGVALEDVDFRVSNVTPQAVGANPNGYAQIFRNKAKFAHVTGNITVSQRSNAATTYVDIRDFDIAKFNGVLKVSDRDEIPALPGGNFRLYDDTDLQAVDYATETTYTARLSDTSGDLSSTTRTAKTWRVGDMQYVVFRDMNSISTLGMTSGDALRVTLPVACADGDFVFGHIRATNLASAPSPVGSILSVRVDVGTGNTYATLRACDSGSSTTALLTVGNFSGSNIREFYVGYKVA